MRVALVARSVYPLHQYGGLERHMFDLVRELLARDIAVTLITPPPRARRPADPGADEWLRHPSLTLSHVSYTTFPYANRRGTTILDRSTAYPLFGIRAGRAALRLAASGAVDLVHGSGASVLGYAMARPEERTAPLVFNPQGLEEFGATDPRRAPLKRLGYLPLRACVRRCARAADAVIATDAVLVGPVVTHLRVRRDRVRVIPNAIDLRDIDQFDARESAARLRHDSGVGADDPLLLSVGRLEANKGFDVLVRALAALAAGGHLPSAWRWAVVGDGPMRTPLERAVSAAGLTQRVIFAGRVPPAELHAFYEAATLFVHPTLYEGSSLVTLEAMAHRRAIVATRAGGLPDKVRPGVNGWLVEPGDDRALAAVIREAISDPVRLSAMGNESRSTVEREFSWTAAADRTVELYAELLDVKVRGG